MVVVTMVMKLMMITIYGREAPLNRRRSQYGQRKIRPNKVGGKDHKMYDRQPTKNLPDSAYASQPLLKGGALKHNAMNERE